MLSLLSALPTLSPLLSLNKFSTGLTGGLHSCRTVLMSSLIIDGDDTVDDAIGAPVGPLPSVSRYENCQCNVFNLCDTPGSLRFRTSF